MDWDWDAYHPEHFWRSIHPIRSIRVLYGWDASRDGMDPTTLQAIDHHQGKDVMKIVIDKTND